MFPAMAHQHAHQHIVPSIAQITQAVCELTNDGLVQWQRMDTSRWRATYLGLTLELQGRAFVTVLDEHDRILAEISTHGGSKLPGALYEYLTEEQRRVTDDERARLLIRLFMRRVIMDGRSGQADAWCAMHLIVHGPDIRYEVAQAGVTVVRYLTAV